MLIATTLRAPTASVGAVIQILEQALTLSPAQAGFLTTLPLLAFGILAPIAGRVSRRYGIERTMFLSLAVVAIGVLIRSSGAVLSLYVGTGLVGVGIAVANVLFPGMVKRDFPNKVPTITGICGVFIGLSAAMASAAAIPISEHWGWQGALGVTILFPMSAVLLWMARGEHGAQPISTTSQAAASINVWQSPLAWQVTLFMTINSVLFYVLITWLPTLLTDTGMSAAAAGSLLGFMQLAAIVPGLLLGPLVGRMKDQRAITVMVSLLQVIALTGLLIHPAASPVWVFLFGMCSSCAVLLSFMFMGLRTGGPTEAASLSGMAQCVNFLCSAAGPTVAGWVHGQSNDWSPILETGIGLAIVMGVFGFYAGRDRTLGDGYLG
ncbi:MFS transporter [Herbaspirillum sp. LeCh32-8]|nr:MFS transporter [Herbaspirillum sp. LeCh32-8]